MQRIDLAETPHTPHRAWQIHQPGDIRYQRFEYGQLETGRWYAARTGRRGTQAWVARDERQACDTVDQWLRRSGQPWRQIASTP